MKSKAWLVVSEGAVFEVDGVPPPGEYGEAWVVLRAANMRTALAAGVSVLHEGADWRDNNVLAHDNALAEFEAVQT
jgi:hypothetical protein